MRLKGSSLHTHRYVLNLLFIFQTPHPLYKPSTDYVPCKDPLCASLQPSEDYDCEDPDQCDYEIEYADQYSSLGVLVNDVYLINFTNEVQLKVRMALGLVTLQALLYYPSTILISFLCACSVELLMSLRACSYKRL